MNDTIVNVSGLVKRYGRNTAVDGVSFEARKGEVFGLLGPNGAGKTTTLECVEGLRKYDAGNITIAGIDVRKDEQAVRKLLGVQLQMSSLPGNIRAAEAMSLVCAWHRLPVRLDLLSRFGTEPKKQYGRMSAGQKRRLQLALAVAAGPSVVILDEPTAGLDVEGRVALHGIIRELREKGMTFIMATHDMAEAETMCDRLAIIIKGRMAAAGTPAQVTASGRQETKIRIQTAKTSLTGGETQFGRYMGEAEGYAVWMTRQVSGAVADLLRSIEESGDSVIDMRVERPSLEERFMEIVESEAK
jgi:ABC-type multidrug transport system, ATPase component